MLRKLVQDVVKDQREELRSIWKEGTRKLYARVDSPPPEEKKVSYPIDNTIILLLILFLSSAHSITASPRGKRAETGSVKLFSKKS